MSLKRAWLFALIACILILTACGEQVTEKIYVHLEQAVELEEQFEQQQEPLQEAEEKEHQYYEEIIQLGMDEYEKIVSLAEDALASIEERQNMVQLEMESLESSVDEITQIEPMIEKVEEEEANRILKELYSTMLERFKKYKQLNEVYNETIEAERQLFTLLMDEELEIENLQNQINKVNEKYEEVITAKDEFNEKTDAYNQLKRDFYDSVKLDVHYE
ncbi:YkyA family protein [Halalkalibacter urbisdiaboli]|uniref:YkyA family protein n=1 Tax=Halalkalibacter urbisdiaboli TaxID=1960589 RepID=UPI0013FE0BBB|nr:YkyA family protein [Halalkalibacter urbisdiaboli]